ncbi:hypothetical protein ID866_4956 [Astraeus odoratus]|nr:hypothetical protein ID866_4956 [Astraeus odoratus]
MDNTNPYSPRGRKQTTNFRTSGGKCGWDPLFEACLWEKFRLLR